MLALSWAGGGVVSSFKGSLGASPLSVPCHGQASPCSFISPGGERHGGGEGLWQWLVTMERPVLPHFEHLSGRYLAATVGGCL